MKMTKNQQEGLFFCSHLWVGQAWNYFPIRWMPCVAPRRWWMIFLLTGVSVLRFKEQSLFFFFLFSSFFLISSWRGGYRGEEGSGNDSPSPPPPPLLMRYLGRNLFESTFPKFSSSSVENPCRDRMRAKSKGKDCLALIYLSLGISNKQITVIFNLVRVPAC